MHLEDQLNKEIHFWVEKLDLLPHPEGGYYRETYRSEESIQNGKRQLLTVIYFLLTSENPSRFHRIKSDEHWFYHAGSPLTVHVLHHQKHEKIRIGNDLNAGQTPHAVVPKNVIFGSSVETDESEKFGYSLVSCAVAPGFDFEDFELLDRETLLNDFPKHEEIILKLT